MFLKFNCSFKCFYWPYANYPTEKLIERELQALIEHLQDFSAVHIKIDVQNLNAKLRKDYEDETS